MFEPLNSVLLAYKLKPMPTAPIEREADPTKPCIVFFSEAEKRVASGCLIQVDESIDTWLWRRKGRVFMVS